MKNLKFIFAILIIALFISCDSNEDSNPVTTCESDFFGFTSATSFINTGDTFDVGKYHKSSTLGSLTNLFSGNALTGTTGWMNNYRSTYNTSLNELTCLLPSNNKLIKCNTTTGIISNITINNVAAPVYIGTSLRLLKYSNVITTTGTAFPKISSVDLQIVDENGISISGTATTKSLPLKSLGSMKEISSATDGIRIYYLANCELIIYDITSNTFSVRAIDTFNIDTDRKFYQGLELKNNTTLVALKQSVIPTVKIEIASIDITSTSLSTSIFNITQSMLPSTAPTLATIINAEEYRTTTYDSCDDNYYFTYSTPSIVSAASTKIFEVKLNTASTSTPVVNVFTDSTNRILFALEKGS